MITKVVPNISKLFNKNNCEGKDSDGHAEGGTFLFATKDRLFKMQGDYSILESRNEYISMGSGKYHADGAMEATKDLGLTQVERITKALEAAERHQLKVRRPFLIMNTEDDEVIVIE